MGCSHVDEDSSFHLIIYEKLSKTRVFFKRQEFLEYDIFLGVDFVQSFRAMINLKAESEMAFEPFEVVRQE